MDSIPTPRRSKFAKTFSKITNLKKSTKNRSNSGFCIPITAEKLRCCESKLFDEEAMAELRDRAAMEAFVAKLFAAVSSVKAAYAAQQMAQLPYDDAAVQSADQAVVDELRAVSELKRRFLKNQIDSSPPHVVVMLAEIQEQQSLMKTYEITMRKMQREIDHKSSQISSLREKLKEINRSNRVMEKTMNATGNFSVLETVSFHNLSVNDFVVVLNYALKSVRHFVKQMIRDMESANWDIDAAVNAILGGVKFSKRDHRGFAFESFVCREIFSGFDDPIFGIERIDSEKQGRRIFFFEEFKKLRSVSVSHFVKHNQSSLFGKFLKSRYLNFVHPKMEFSFCGNLNQRKTVNAGELPETEFFKMFAEMSRRVWLLHCLAFSFDGDVGIFRVEKDSRFSEVYMENVSDDVFAAAGGGLRVALTVVPGFQFRHTVVQSKVYLIPSKC
ncbi:protein GRAVITROPIC IN THE LIGHT 1-like [Salvia miltiorrhiza]|uniref:protein GRAVITROPIC IN THE LIGHT 1-like n=1 Tax=Salvia miltiorrhiza TaxID=226208 RepID=UPI0025AC0F08|nr:protein GRAVITROPIC IN THE LIGHT 1-like [Salvia miltiorrhiza]